MKNPQTVASESGVEKTRGGNDLGSVATPIRATVQKAAPPSKSSTRPTSTATAKPSAPKRKAKASSIPDADLQQMIQEQAYFRSERRGFVAGFELQDWFEAEEEIYRLMKLELPKH